MAGVARPGGSAQREESGRLVVCDRPSEGLKVVVAQGLERYATEESVKVSWSLLASNRDRGVGEVKRGVAIESGRFDERRGQCIAS